MKKYAWLLIAGWLFSQCSGRTDADQSGQEAAGTPPPEDSSAFFPVTAYLQAQINRFDSMPVTVLQIKSGAQQPDSSWIRREDMKTLLAPFTADSIGKDNLRELFRENRFSDQSTASITLTYLPRHTPLPPGVNLRRWDVYVDPETGELKMVYIHRELNRNGQTIQQQLIWKTAQWAKIAESGTGTDGQPLPVQEVKWIWGNH